LVFLHERSRLSGRDALHQTAVARIFRRFNILPQHHDRLQKPAGASFGDGEEAAGRVEQSYGIGAGSCLSYRIAMRHAPGAIFRQSNRGHMTEKVVR
jgi:hypothetical protein